MRGARSVAPALAPAAGRATALPPAMTVAMCSAPARYAASLSPWSVFARGQLADSPSPVGSPSSAHAPEQREQPDVGDAVRNLAPEARLERAEKVQLATVGAAVVRAAERHDAIPLITPAERTWH
jgi:hypothetical protein